MPRFSLGRGGGTGGGAGFSLGPEQNQFTSVAAMTNYGTANADWLAEYDANRDFLAEVTVSSTVTYYRRNGSAWEVVTNVIKGGRGQKGDSGLQKASMWYRAGQTAGDRISKPANTTFTTGVDDVITFTGGAEDESFNGGLDSGRITWLDIFSEPDSDPIPSNVRPNSVFELAAGTYNVKARFRGRQTADTSSHLALMSIESGDDQEMIADAPVFGSGNEASGNSFQIDYEYMVLTSPQKFYFQLFNTLVTRSEIKGYLYVEQLA